MGIKKHIPNTITLLNLFCGCLSIYFSFRLQNFEYAGYTILAGGLFDFLDGMIARLLNVSSEIGLQLDSFADIISFGLAPACIIFSFLEKTNSFEGSWVPFLAFLITIGAALRLAIFNLDKSQKNEFKGLPTPATAIMIVGLIFIQENFPLLKDTYFLIGFSLILSSLMILPIPMLALKFSVASWLNYKWQYLFILSVIILSICLKLQSLSLIIFSYLFFSVLKFLSKKYTRL